MSEYIIIDGVKSSDFGMYMINDRGYAKNWIPKNDIHSQKLPLQSGERYVDSYHGAKKIEIECSIEKNDESYFNKLSKIISKNKQVKLTLSTEPHKEYTAVLQNEVNPRLYVNGGTFALSYIAHFPYANSRFTTGGIAENGLTHDMDYYYNSGLLYNDTNDIDYIYENITTTTNMDIYNGSNVDGSRPNIIIDGSADGVAIKRFLTSDRVEEVDRISYGAFNGMLEINCLLRDTFLDGSVNNLTLDGRYFKLTSGEITNIQSGSDCTINGNQIQLGDDVSAVDDYYNGYYISLIKQDRSRVFYKIVDYDGASKIAYLDNDAIAKDGEYGIYDIITGMNYFTIEGTNMNINSIKWDFKFLYN